MVALVFCTAVLDRHEQGDPQEVLPGGAAISCLGFVLSMGLHCRSSQTWTGKPSRGLSRRCSNQLLWVCAKHGFALQFKTDTDRETFKRFFQEVQQAVDSKQLRPMIRTQYNRTAFQVPFDATVRISLDTNLAMIKENTDGQPVGLLHRCCPPLLPFAAALCCCPLLLPSNFPETALKLLLSSGSSPVAQSLTQVSFVALCCPQGINKSLSVFMLVILHSHTSLFRCPLVPASWAILFSS